MGALVGHVVVTEVERLEVPGSRQRRSHVVHRYVCEAVRPEDEGVEAARLLRLLVQAVTQVPHPFVLRNEDNASLTQNLKETLQVSFQYSRSSGTSLLGTAWCLS